MLFSLQEVLDIVIMTVALGFIFKDVFLPRRARVVDTEHYDPLKHYKSIGQRYRLGGFVFAMIVTAPAVILHEFGHKFVAMGFGAAATFNAAYFWLGIGVLLKLLNFGFIFFVPAYVAWAPATAAAAAYMAANPWVTSVIAFAGPGVNLVLFAVPTLLLKSASFRKQYKKYLPIIFLTAKVNLFLFIFNMLPIPMFDGWHVYAGLIKTFF
ncbi:M50 family metallopeptidase [Candidatus Woesearchaeota archaeon]|nr:M50 family metallopeptidase [Candidatus Woesearchaeota archaeon]